MVEKILEKVLKNQENINNGFLVNIQLLTKRCNEQTTRLDIQSKRIDNLEQEINKIKSNSGTY